MGAHCKLKILDLNLGQAEAQGSDRCFQGQAVDEDHPAYHTFAPLLTSAIFLSTVFGIGPNRIKAGPVPNS